MFLEVGGGRALSLVGGRLNVARLVRACLG